MAEMDPKMDDFRHQMSGMDADDIDSDAMVSRRDDEMRRREMEEMRRRREMEEMRRYRDEMDDMPRRPERRPSFDDMRRDDVRPSLDDMPRRSEVRESVSTPPPASRPTPPPSRQNAQEALRARMRQQNGSTGEQVVLEQTDSYKPTGATPTEQPAQSTPEQSTPQNNTVVINGSDNSEGKGFKMNGTMVAVICGAVVLLFIVGAVMLKGKISLGGDETEDFYDPFEDPNIEWLTPGNSIVDTGLYSPEEITALRIAGYTGTEIEDYQAQGIPSADLIRQAEAERDAWIQQAVAPLYDTASDEYKHYVSQTWLTLPERHDMYDWTMIGWDHVERKNLDYEKIDVYGNQLFIKIYLDDNTHEDWFFLAVTPDEWLQLNDSGNVIVNYTYRTHLVGDDFLNSYEDMDNIFIISANLEIIGTSQ